MDVATETLYSREQDATAFFKMVRLARTFRKVLMTNPQANISIVGYLSKHSVDSNDLDTNLTRMSDRFKKTRDQLTSCGVLEKSIAGYLPLQAAPITEDLIVVTARDTPTRNLSPGKLVPVGDNSIDEGQGSIVVDPFLPPAIPKKQIIIGYTLIPKGLQGVATIDPQNPLSTLHQFSFTITRPRHAPYAAGPEELSSGQCDPRRAWQDFQYAGPCSGGIGNQTAPGRLDLPSERLRSVDGHRAVEQNSLREYSHGTDGSGSFRRASSCDASL